MARPRRSQPSRDRLIDEGISSLLRDGYHGTGLNAVLERAGVPKGSFYNHFKSKEDFAIAAIERYAECLGQQLEAAMTTASSPREGLEGFLRSQMDEYAAAEFVGGCLVANLGGELEGNEACRGALQASMRGFRDGLQAAIDSAQTAGQFRSDMTARSMADLLVSAWEGAVIRMKIERSLEPLEQCVQQILGGYFDPAASVAAH